MHLPDYYFKGYHHTNVSNINPLFQPIHYHFEWNSINDGLHGFLCVQAHHQGYRRPLPSTSVRRLGSCALTAIWVSVADDLSASEIYGLVDCCQDLIGKGGWDDPWGFE